MSTTDILIVPVHKFQNSYLKEHLWKDASVLQKAYCLRIYCLLFMKHIVYCSWKHLSKSTSIEAQRNIERIYFRFKFPKFPLVKCFILHFCCTALSQSAKWKKLLTVWNEYQESTTSIGFQFYRPKLSRESCFSLSLNYSGLYKERSTKKATDNFQCRAL